LRHRLILIQQYTPNLEVLWKIGHLGTSHAFGIHYRLGKHMKVGGSLGIYQAHGFDISYQREWG